MLEMLFSPRKAERHTWEMLFIGFLYASLSILLVNWIFSSDPVLSKYSGILIVTFSVMFSLPFVYYCIKNEEERDIQEQGIFRILKEHRRALMSLLWLFIGFVIAFSLWHIVLGDARMLNAQIETYCVINRPGSFNDCVKDYGLGKITTTGSVTSNNMLLTIFSNNVYVLIFTLVFSLIFGAGAIFILAWNASVIAAAVGIFAKTNLARLPCGLFRYLIHGIPEIAAYFIAAMAGGIVSVAIIRHDTKSEKFWGILQDSLNLIIVAVIILLLSALIEVFITPGIFSLVC